MTKSRGIRQKRDPICTFPECGRPHRRGGLCDAHSLQMKRWGFLLPLGMRPRGANREAYSETYTAVHMRLRKWAGPASGYDCVRCGQPGSDWSYDGTDPRPLTHYPPHREPYQYSADLSRYEPLCRPCHTSVDRYGHPRRLTTSPEPTGP